MKDLAERAPFRFAFSLSPLIDYWNNTLAGAGPYWAREAASVREELAGAPELQGAIEDLSVLESHRDLVAKLMSVVFPAAFWETEVSAALVPFTMQPAYVSPRFQKLFVDETGGLRGQFHVGWTDFHRARLIGSYLCILRQCHGMEKDLEFPLIRMVTEPETGLDRYFRFWPDNRFMDVRPIEPPRPLTDEDRLTIMEHITEPQVVSEILRPENFEFHGFTVVHVVDVTQSELLSALQWELVGGGSMFASERFLKLQHLLETIFQRSGLCIGLAAIQGDELLMLNTGCGEDCNCIFCDSMHVPVSQFRGSLFQKAVDSSHILRISDLSKVSDRSAMDEQFLRDGIRSLLIAPLIYHRKPIGVLSVGSPRPSDLGATQEILAGQILPFFTMALKRGLNELNSQVDSIIKEKCTAVHPSVEWRFRKAALSHLDRTARRDSSEMEPIVFRDVYPLYATSDIRGSSEARNRAIRADLLEHLDLAFNVLREAETVRSLPIFSELTHRIGSYRELTEGGLARGDETALLNFLRNEFEAVLPLLHGFGPAMAEVLQRYSDAIDPAMSTVYRERRDFEQSMAAFKRKVSLYLDREEAEAQAMFPHYFNKHQTDGVEYLIYVGASMVENVEFSRLAVRNLRLWQLMVACGIAWHCKSLKENLKVSLEATHLILVNDSPLSIRFRFDEKRFDVDGAYDIAHEIVRSCVDKAVVKGTNERLTQPDRIAVVYSRPDEAEEMHQHIKFLQCQGLLNDDLEWLELDDLPGVQGLKALRMSVNLASPELAVTPLPARFWGNSAMEKVNASQIVADIRSGFSDRDLSEKYGISERRLRRVLRLLVSQSAIGHEELYEKSATYREMTDILASRRCPRVRIPFAVRICHEATSQRGLVRDISDNGLRVAGIRADVGETITLSIPPQEYIEHESLRFQAVCRSCSTRGRRTEYSVSGFEITDISEESRTRLRLILQEVQSRILEAEQRSQTKSYRHLTKQSDAESSGEYSSRQFSGYVVGIDILDFVQFLFLIGKKARLTIHSSQLQQGDLYFSDGKLVHAVQGNLEGKEAFFACMNFSEGEFSVEPWKETEPRTIDEPGDFLLVEAARRRDELC